MNVIEFIKPAILTAGIRILPQASLDAIGDGEITVTNIAGYQETIACDAVIEGMDMLPNKALADELSDFNVVAVGDCDDPWNISEAISTGNIAARNI